MYIIVYIKTSYFCFNSFVGCYVSDEIITSRKGDRVRVGNTDAEGRMAMADALYHMKEKVSNIFLTQIWQKF